MKPVYLYSNPQDNLAGYFLANHNWKGKIQYSYKSIPHTYLWYSKSSIVSCLRVNWEPLLTNDGEIGIIKNKLSEW